MTLALHTKGTRTYTQEVVDVGHARELVKSLDRDEEWALIETGDDPETGRELLAGRGPAWPDRPPD